MSVLHAATRRQNQAAEPDASTWLSANAGSGKTRVLTDRVARLLLNGVSPQNILCLTYTKAAATEMQNRLFQRLGTWSMTEDPDLTAALQHLGVEGLDHARLSQARRLFARAIETPGGLRIQTIHSFCTSLLRRFPLEAGVSPRFAEMDDRAAALLRDDLLESLAAGEGRDAIDAVAAVLSDVDLVRLTSAVIQHRARMAGGARFEEIADWFGLPPAACIDDWVAAAFDGTEPALIARIDTICQTLAPSYVALGGDLAALNWSKPDEALYRACCDLFTDSKGEFKIGRIPQSNHKAARAAFEPVAADLDALIERVAAVRDLENRLDAAHRTKALYDFAAVFLPAYERQKQLRGWLDFDDLIQKTIALLSDPQVADWVLYRLDGGLDHILVDEAQDTSPAQWTVIERLAQEFTSGRGSREDRLRTIFVVGDKKQSIYSFQGADPREFDRMQAHFADRLKAIEAPFRALELEFSFRSSDAILRVVDQVAETHGVAQPDMRHRAFHAELPGRVDLWAPVPPNDKLEKKHWYDPVDIVGTDHHDVTLARKIADQIARMIETETIPAGNGKCRKITPGDFMILVRRRTNLFQEIIRACKARGLPVAGADRLKLGAELAVKDLSALLSFLATPEDSLSLAAVLRSPLFGWSEAELYKLAADRAEQHLWPALRHRSAEFPETVEILQDLLASADFLRPFDLLERILIRHDGRRRLLARLGPEAEDGIDELLTQALAFERVEVPSLTGFLVWMETDDVEVKRQMDAAGDLVRVMTVHGAKGLESPIVILPDTSKLRRPPREEIVTLEEGRPIWAPLADRQPEVVKEALAQLKDRQREEWLRLLYVAMTRAEAWLIVTAAGDVGKSGESWYQIVADALGEIGAETWDSPTGSGYRYGHGRWSAAAPVTSEPVGSPTEPRPAWADIRIAAPARTAGPKAPSDLGGDKAVLQAGDPDADREASLLLGRRVHRLLEHLPARPPGEWSALAARLLATGADAADAPVAQELLDMLRPVMLEPDLAFLFGDAALTEVDITAELPAMGGLRISGAIDRLIVAPDKVLAVDFKTNAQVPASPEEVPEGLLRQMGAYQAALERVYPDRAVEVAILWTGGPDLMPLGRDIVMSALRRATAS